MCSIIWSVVICKLKKGVNYYYQKKSKITKVQISDIFNKVIGLRYVSSFDDGVSDF